MFNFILSIWYNFFPDYIGSFVDEISDLHNFTLKSQWLHLLEFNFEAKEVCF